MRVCGSHSSPGLDPDQSQASTRENEVGTRVHPVSHSPAQRTAVRTRVPPARFVTYVTPSTSPLPRRDLPVAKEATQIHGPKGRTGPVELVAELTQYNPWHSGDHMSEKQSGRLDAAPVLEERVPPGHAIRQSHIHATGTDPIGTHVTVTKVVGGFAVRWLDNDEDVTDTYPTLTEALERYEDLIRAFDPGTERRDENGDPVWDETDIDFRKDCPFCGEKIRAAALLFRYCRPNGASRSGGGQRACGALERVPKRRFIVHPHDG